jgi:hypothetical protein
MKSLKYLQKIVKLFTLLRLPRRTPRSRRTNYYQLVQAVTGCSAILPQCRFQIHDGVHAL